jgi:tRNA (Thr-GGU) A37 N-methylase
MTVVDLIGIEGNVLRVLGLDAINGTPLLDLNPALEYQSNSNNKI